MRYTVDTNSKIIKIEGQISSEELKGLCEQYTDYSFSGSAYDYIPYYPNTAPISPYRITCCTANGTLIAHSNNTFTRQSKLMKEGEISWHK